MINGFMEITDRTRENLDILDAITYSPAKRNRWLLSGDK
jgi:hypothetical protein